MSPVTPKSAPAAETKIRSKRFKGIGVAAAALNVTRGHLWAVLTGRRESGALLARYRKYLNSPVPQPPSINIAAYENLSPEFFAIKEKLKQNTLIVRFTWLDKPEIMGQLVCENELGALLVAAHAGQYDSTDYETGVLWHFFIASDMGKAMQILRDAIAERGLLDRTTILHAEEHNQLRVWYPPTAEKITAE